MATSIPLSLNLGYRGSSDPGSTVSIFPFGASLDDILARELLVAGRCQPEGRVSTLSQPSRPFAERLAQRASDWLFPVGPASGSIGECVSGWHGLGAGARGEGGERGR
ncbi:hypothetical protein NET02_02110 [Thermomicrobiaceae bacterium CFH 74404]|uniref:Uncharacterized protein n=1 Tax=Thermalbibacter longus TaxID=2951981 RepID=A0AA41WEF6_9BACT|nr:hypothetical protein [Thermalbibacter longus]